MIRQLLLLATILVFSNQSHCQSTFNFTVDVQPVTVSNLPGLHSYAFAQHNGKWLILGGRKDGLHARQPFNAFPQLQNNTDIYVIDVNTNQVWNASVNTLPTGLKEQLQSTNMNFFQDEDTLFIVGGYAFSASANDHVTFPNLTSVSVSNLISSIINNAPIAPHFKQITDTLFAVTGGQMGKIGNTFYLVGGQKFDGRYNPMGHATYTQEYTNQIRKFTIDNSGSNLSFANYSAITDPIHLRRRDYNLLPQIFPNGVEGYTISSGVFQLGADLPFLYPVDITNAGHTPVNTFNQYLSNYHSAHVSLYDSTSNEMHSLFFGGLSQYYYQNGSLVQDNQVPFVKTISLLTRSSAGTLQEYQLPVEMPVFVGAGAEFILNHVLPSYQSDIIKLEKATADTLLLGHILGGIESPSINPFSSNQTATTSASSTVYAVRLIKSTAIGIQEIDGNNPFSIDVFPNPLENEIHVEFNLTELSKVSYFLTAANGQIISKGQINDHKVGTNKVLISIDDNTPSQALQLTFVFDNKYFVTKTVVKK